MPAMAGLAGAPEEQLEPQVDSARRLAAPAGQPLHLLRAQAPRGRLLGAIAALGAVFIWGFTFVPTKVALVEMGPFSLAALRFCLALAVILPAARLQPATARLRRVSWPELILTGLAGVTLFFGLQNLGLVRTSATEAGLITGSVPALTALLSALLLKEVMSASRLLGIAISIGGVAIVVLGAAATGGDGSLEGDIIVLGAVVAWAFYTLLNKRASGKMPDVVLLAYSMAIGTLFLLPPAAFEVATQGFGPMTVSGFLSLLFLGLAGSGAAFYCWNVALRHLDASEATTYINLVPVVTVLSAAIMLGERPAPIQIAGGSLVLLGVYLSGRRT